jgi:hypothetical protein
MKLKHFVDPIFRNYAYNYVGVTFFSLFIYFL